MAAPKPPKSLVGPLKKVTLTRPAKPRNVGRDPKVKPYALAVGTPNEMNDQIQAQKLANGVFVDLPPIVPANKRATRFMHEKDAKKAAIEFFEEKRWHCDRYNKAGLPAIDAAIAELQALPSLITTPRTVNCLFDEYAGMTATVRLWVADPKAAEENQRK